MAWDLRIVRVGDEEGVTCYGGRVGKLGRVYCEDLVGGA